MQASETAWWYMKTYIILNIATYGIVIIDLSEKNIKTKHSRSHRTSTNS